MRSKEARDVMAISVRALEAVVGVAWPSGRLTAAREP